MRAKHFYFGESALPRLRAPIFISGTGSHCVDRLADANTLFGCDSLVTLCKHDSP